MSFIPEARKGQDRLFNAEALNLAKKIYYLDKCFFHYNSYMESVTNRYNENIVNLTILEVSSLRNLINKYNFDRIYNDYLNARICTRFYSMLRLYYFNELNNKKYKEVKREIKRVLCSEPFKSAFKNVKWKFLNFKEKVFVFSLKMRLIRFSKFLVNKKVKETSKIIK